MRACGPRAMTVLARGATGPRRAGPLGRRSWCALPRRDGGGRLSQADSFGMTLVLIYLCAVRGRSIARVLRKTADQVQPSEDKLVGRPRLAEGFPALHAEPGHDPG